MPRESRVHIDDQIAAGAEFFQRQALQPGWQRRHPQLFPVRRQRVLQSGEGGVVEHQGVPGAQPVAGGAHHAALPARSELAQRNALGREFSIENRVEEVQRTVDKFAGVHRQRAVLALPAAVAKGQVAQAQVEVGYRPVRSLQAGVGDVQAANLQRGDRG